MDTAERLIESTRALLWERGYTGTSPRAIQSLAGAGQGSMYHHFRGKPDLAAVAILRTADELRSRAAALLDGPGGAVERITAYLTLDRDVLRGCPIGRLTQDPDVLADPTLHYPVAETFTWLCDRLSAVLSSGGLRSPLDPDDTAAAIVAMLQGGYVLARAAGSREPFDRAVRGALGLLRSGAA
ncbi:TetR/AcrR family transcriptional regulator [Dactylosporangium siamense]|uniref:TetR family transcriptional regulator n=1 Tax=Dactylosporangium siamense TaxID=685454 RepID=A0A919PGB5_9ACTN|nr:TetR/AcrR family transcriptional regulator [Dactylosporangium siamense]GIG42065.1 TetR family transcriptional regulator [Dactylosporangium siamense]